MSRPGTFQKGNKSAAKADHTKAGRKPDWFKKKCEELLDKHKLLEFVADVASGEAVSKHITEDGAVIDVPADTRDRLRAVEFLSDRAFGKAGQAVEVNPGDGQSWAELFREIANAH